jgi:hypothetical protein
VKTLIQFSEWLTAMEEKIDRVLCKRGRAMTSGAVGLAWFVLSVSGKEETPKFPMWDKRGRKNVGAGLGSHQQ